MERETIIKRIGIMYRINVEMRARNGKISCVEDAKYVVPSRQHHYDSILHRSRIKVWKNENDSPLTFYALEFGHVISVNELSDSDLAYILRNMEQEYLDEEFYPMIEDVCADLL